MFATELNALVFAAFCFSNSSRVKNFLSAKDAGRSSGTSELKLHTPRKSGWPDSVRGALYFASAPAADVAVVVSARTNISEAFLISISPLVARYDDFPARMP